jgi:hypothetical protein
MRGALSRIPISPLVGSIAASSHAAWPSAFPRRAAAAAAAPGALRHAPQRAGAPAQGSMPSVIQPCAPAWRGVVGPPALLRPLGHTPAAMGTSGRAWASMGQAPAAARGVAATAGDGSTGGTGGGSTSGEDEGASPAARPRAPRAPRAPRRPSTAAAAAASGSEADEAEAAAAALPAAKAPRRPRAARPAAEAPRPGSPPDAPEGGPSSSAAAPAPAPAPAARKARARRAKPTPADGAAQPEEAPSSAPPSALLSPAPAPDPPPPLAPLSLGELLADAPPAPPGGGPSAWDLARRWVVFSDLHVTQRTLGVCIQVGGGLSAVPTLGHPTIEECVLKQAVAGPFVSDKSHPGMKEPVLVNENGLVDVIPDTSGCCCQTCT